MNPFDSKPSNAPVPLLVKEKRKSSGDSRSKKSSVSKSSCPSPLAVLQRSVRAADSGSKEWDSDSSLCRSVISAWTPTTTIIPDSSSDGEESLKSPSELKRDIQRKKKIKNSKSFNLSSSQNHQYKFGESPKLMRNSVSNTEQSNTPQTSPSIPRPNHIQTSQKRLKQLHLRSRSPSPRGEAEMTPFSVLTTPKSWPKGSGSEEIVIDDDDSIQSVINVESETPGRSRSYSTETVSSSLVVLPLTSTNVPTTITLSDDEEQHIEAPRAETGGDVDDTDDKMDIEIIENALNIPLITPRKRRNRGNKGDDKIESNVSCVNLDTPSNSPKNFNSEISNLSKNEEGFLGFGTGEKSSGLDEQKKEDKCEKTDASNQPEDRDESNKIVISDPNEINKHTKPCSVNCSDGKKQADDKLVKRLSGEEEDRGNVGKLRSRGKSTSIDKVEEIPMEVGKLRSKKESSSIEKVEQRHMEAGRLRIRGKSTSIDKTEETSVELGKLRIRKKSNSTEKVEVTPIQGGEMSIGSEKNTPTVDEILCVNVIETVQSEEKSDTTPEPVKKKRGRKPGFKCKPKIKKSLQQLVEKVDKPDKSPCTSSGPAFRIISKSQAERLDAKLIVNDNDRPVEKKRKGRKPGGKNKLKSKSPSRIMKRGRKRRIKDKPVENLNSNNDDDDDDEIPGCCISSGCIHGNNYKKSGRLPSLPPNPEYILAEQQFNHEIQKNNELVLETKDETTDSGTDNNCSSSQKAIILFPPTVIANSDLNGKEVVGMKVSLVPKKLSVAEDSGSKAGEDDDSSQTLEVTSEDITQKPKIIQDKVFPKGTLNHVLSRLHETPDSPKRKEFGIRSTLPSRRALNPSSSCENIDAKIASVFNNHWKGIPEIAALLEPSSKRKRSEESSDGDTIDTSDMRRQEKRQSLLSESVSNIDLQNGNANASVQLNGLFTDPHIISRHSSKFREKKSIGNGQRIKNKKFEDKSRSNPPLTKENLSIFDESTDAQDSTDVISNIMSQMQPPGKMVTNNTIHKPKKSSATNPKYPLKPNETVEMKLKSYNRKRGAADIQSLQSPESKRMKKKGQWSINNDNDDASSCTSNESRPSAFASHKSLLSSFGKKSIDGKHELIAAWLDTDVANNEESQDEDSHSSHSAKTYVKTPNKTEYDNQLQIEQTLGSNLLSPSKDVEEDNDDKSQGNESDNTSSNHSSTKTVTKSLKESSSSGIGTQEREKQDSFETEGGESTRDASEALPKANPPVDDDDNNKDKDEEDEDALRLDYEDDDFLFDEPLENHEDKEDKDKKQSVPPLKVKRAIKNPITVAASSSDQSPNRNPPVFNSPRIAKRDNKPLNDSDEKLERGSTASDEYQMKNFDKFASQTAREFNDQYSVPDGVDAHEPDDAYDPYAPVETEAECRIIFPKDPKQYFRGLCFAYLQKGICPRLDCPFHNKQYSFHLQNLPKAQPVLIELVLNYAIGQKYFHLLSDIYPEAIKRLELRGIERICRKIHYEAQLLKTKANNFSATFYQHSMKPTVEALMSKNYSPKTIINILCGCFLFDDDEDRKKLMRTITATKAIPSGKHWDVFEDLIKQVDSSLPGFLVKLILDDCFKYDKSREYLQDIYEHVIKKTPAQTLADFDQGLLRPFRQFFGGFEQPPPETNNRGNTTPMPETTMDFDVACHDSGPPIQNNYSIASPDGNDEDGERYEEKREEKKVTEIRRKSVKERLGHRVGSIKPRNMTEPEESYELIPIDRVSKPTSVYKKYLWSLHLDLQNIEQSLKHRNYVRVIDILASAKNQEAQPFAKGFYNILCKQVMESAENMAAVMKHSGSKFFEKSENGHYRVKN